VSVSPLAESLAASGYEGWVAYVDGSPIFEARPANVSLAQLIPGAVDQVRAAARDTVEWRDLPQERVQAVELYAFHGHWGEQPILRIDREPGFPQMRFIQMKLRGLIVPTHGARGLERTGIAGYRIGYYNPPRAEYDLLELTPQYRSQMDPAGGFRPPGAPPLKGHPCWPRPHGFGLAPHTVGLTEDQVPSPPGAA
jgi:hypothetical protein